MWIRVPSTGTCFSRKSPIVERQITIFDGSTVSNYRIFVDKSHVLSLHHGKSVNHQILLRKNILLVKSYVNFRYIQFPFIKSHEKSRCFRLIHHVSLDWFRENLHRKPSIFHSFSHEICFFSRKPWVFLTVFTITGLSKPGETHRTSPPWRPRRAPWPSWRGFASWPSCSAWDGQRFVEYPGR